MTIWICVCRWTYVFTDLCEKLYTMWHMLYLTFMWVWTTMHVRPYPWHIHMQQILCECVSCNVCLYDHISQSGAVRGGFRDFYVDVEKQSDNRVWSIYHVAVAANKHRYNKPLFRMWINQSNKFVKWLLCSDTDWEFCSKESGVFLLFVCCLLMQLYNLSWAATTAASATVALRGQRTAIYKNSCK